MTFTEIVLELHKIALKLKKLDNIGSDRSPAQIEEYIRLASQLDAVQKTYDHFVVNRKVVDRSTIFTRPVTGTRGLTFTDLVILKNKLTLQRAYYEAIGPKRTSKQRAKYRSVLKR